MPATVERFLACFEEIDATAGEAKAPDPDSLGVGLDALVKGAAGVSK